MNRLTGKVAIVTGGASGIGFATSELFASEGARVIACDIQQPREPYRNDRIQHATLNVSDEANWAKVVADCLAQFGQIDVLVNNAGIGGAFADVADVTLDAWNAVIAVNQTGVMLGMRAVLPAMRARKSGSIINLSSIWGINAVAVAAAYQATKAAVRHLSKHAAVAYAVEGIRVNSVHPGLIATPLTLEQQPEQTRAAIIAATPMQRMGRPIDIAQGCLFLASDASNYMTGAELVIDGGYTAQ